MSSSDLAVIESTAPRGRAPERHAQKPMRVFSAFEDKHRALFGNQPIRLDHLLHLSPLFSRDALADLIERYPREHYALVHMGAQKERRLWREGEIGGLSGHEVMESIANGRMWLNLRNVKAVDPRFEGLLDAIFGELGEKIPGFKAHNLGLGILISSPKAQVYYHADLPGQSLWQISGSKRVYVYPPVAPFLTPRDLENIALFNVEVDMPYEAWYDEHAVVFDLEPGQMLHWPLNAPHRVENHDCLNISMTIEYWTDEIARSHKVNVANGLLRHKLGREPRSRRLEGPGFWAKNVLQKAMRDSGWVKQQRKARRPVDFRLDPMRPGAILDLPARPAA